MNAWDTALRATDALLKTFEPYFPLVERVFLQGAFFVAVLFAASFLRKAVCARLSMTPVPSVVLPFAVTLKYLSKQLIFTKSTERSLFVFVPFLALFLFLFLFLLVPFFAFSAVARVEFGALYTVFILYLGVYAFILGGFASNSRFALIGTVRALMRLLSVQLVLVLTVVTVMLSADATHLQGIVEAQKKVWYVVLHFPLAFVFTACTVFLLNIFRFETPFAQKELASGVYAEYSGALYLFLRWSDYALTVFMALLGAFLFLGGGEPLHTIDGVPDWIWLSVKTGVFFFIFVLAENTLPDYRSDKLLKITFLRFLPFCAIWLFATAVVCVLLTKGAL